MSHFIVIEGIDGAGTTTQTQRLVSWLESRDIAVFNTREPTDGTIGKMIRRILAGDSGLPVMDTLPWLFAADRADHIYGKVIPSLEAGTWVVSDRYYHSSLAYQSLHQPLEDVHALNRKFRTPDLTIFLEISVDDALTRIEARGEAKDVYEERDNLTKIADAYGDVMTLLAGQGEPIKRMDATDPIDYIAEQIRQTVRELAK
jgi:dTMP kinase